MSEVRGPLWELTSARTKEMLREPEAVFWVFAFPVLLALALGFAFREEGAEKVPVGVVAGAPSSAKVTEALAASPGLKARAYERKEGELALSTGKISLLVETDPLVFRFDPARPDSRMAKLEASDAIDRASGVKRSSVPERHVSEKGSRYIDFLLPGLLGMNLMGTGMWGIGFSIVTSRTRKLLKRLIATPMRRSEYLLAQIFARFIFLVGEVAILIGCGKLFFDVPLRGSIVLFSLICVIGALAFSGLGLLVASRAQTVEGVSGLMNLVMLPMWVCSGVFFSSERFPDAAQPFIQALPLTALNDALRAVMLEGASAAAVASELLVLAIWGVVSFIIALRIFRWR